MRLLFYLIIFFFFFAGSLFAQEMYLEKPAKFITAFHFRQLSGGVILLKAAFNDVADSLNFILDTGSGGISLDSATTETYQIPHVPSGRYIYGIAGVRKVDYAKSRTLSFPGLKVDSLDFYINNYEILSSVYGTKIDGIIGYSFLSRYVVKINFDSSKISIYEPGFIRYPNNGTLLRPDLKGLPIVSLTIRDARKVTANFYFDTGAGLCFLISKQLNEDSAVLLKRRKPVSIEVQGLGGRKRMHLSIMREVHIGPYKFRKVPTYILDDEFNIFAYPKLGGLIGDDLLRRFNLTINYPQKEIHLKPNGHFYDSFDYSYTGMTMYSINGVVIVDDIVEGSPAEKSGLKNGDIIMGVDNDFSSDVEVYKNLLQKTSNSIRILILRDSKPEIIFLKVGRIK
ncbi:MAG: aspartyl protease family protein [Ginsengibacter sp.]